jgi:hypothetical protein
MTLWPQLGGGLDFFVHSAHCQYDTFIAKPLNAGQSPTQAGIFIDLINCWNQMSPANVKMYLRLNPASMSCSNTLISCTPTQTAATSGPMETLTFFQEDGFPQGDPLSPALTWLFVHHHFLKPIKSNWLNM